MHEDGGEDTAVWIAILASDPLRAIGLQAILEEGLKLPTTILSKEPGPGDRKPTVLVVDEGLGLQPEAGSTSQRVLERNSGLALVLLTRDDSPEAAKRALAAGAKGILTATAEVAQIRACIRSVLRGKVWQPYAGNETPPAGEVAAPLQEANLAERFTPKEREVLRWLAQGHSNRQISATMGIDEATVKAHLGRMLRKADASNRVELTLRALASEKNSSRRQ